MWFKYLLFGAVFVIAGAVASTASAAWGGGDVEWAAYGGDGASSKFVPAGQINSRNVGKLQEKWVWTSPDDAVVAQFNKDGVKLWPHTFEATPIMVDGTLFVATALSQVAAVDPESGRTLWVHDPKSYLAADGRAIAYPPNIGLVQRGVAYWRKGKDRRLFLATGAGTLIALDPATGSPAVAFGQGGSVDLKPSLRIPAVQAFYANTSPPLVCGDVVIVGSTVLDFPLQSRMPAGDLRGYSASDGRLLWTFHTVPQDGEPGADTWTSAEARRNTGAVNVWAPMSCDEKLGLAYVPVSTPANDYYGGNRLGDGLYGDSLVALDAASGQRVWHFQFVHHGLWDYDTPAAPNLIDLTVGGRKVQAVAQVTKQGFVYVLDRATGRPLWPIEERPAPQSSATGEATSPTQPFPTKPAAFDRQGLTDADLIDFTPELKAQAQAVVAGFEHGPLYTPPSEDRSASGGKKGTIFLPGDIGGGSWTGAAVDPRKGTIYIPSITRPFVNRLMPFPPARMVGASSALALPNGLPLTKPPYGRLTAIDLNTGEHIWMRPVGAGPIDHPALKDLKLHDLGWDRRSFFLVTKDLLFGAQEGIVTARQQQLSRLTTLFSLKNDQAYLWALDPVTGKTVFALPLQHGNASGAPMTYVKNGHQFIVVPTGGAGNPARLVAYGL
jgi:quinoprotein glucose dehydrogenase